MLIKINLWLNLIFKFIVLTLAFLAPLFFWTYTTEFYETPKFVLLMVAVSLFIVLWMVKWVLSGKISLTPSKLDIPLLLLLSAFILSTFFAVSKPVAIFGNLPRIHGGLASYTLYIVFYFVLVSNLKKLATVREIIYALLGSAIILSVMGLFSYVGVNLLSLPWTASSNFTPTGSTFSTAAILILLLPFPICAILYGSKVSDFDSQSRSEELDLPINSIIGDETSLNDISVKTIWSIILGLFAVTLVLIGTMPVYIAAAIVFVLILFVTPPNLISKNSIFIFIPILLAVFLALASFVSIGGSKNILYSQAQNFQREPQLPFDVSWKVSVSAFRDSPLWGSGPASYLGDFTLYKPVEFNNTKLWNVRFDQTFNEYLQILATVGAIGLIIMIFLTVTAFATAFKTLSDPVTKDIRLPLAISTIAFFVILALHSSTLTLWIIGILIIVCFLVATKQAHDEIYLGQYSLSNNSSSSQMNLLLVIAAVLLILGLLGLALWQMTQALIADFHHRQGIKAANAGQIGLALNEYVLAENHNPRIDIYRSNLAQVNYTLANYIVGTKGPTEASPAGSLTDEDKQTIQGLLSQAITEGQSAAALNPNDPLNWEILAAIYRQISGVAKDALSYSLDAYGRAMQRNPLNPILRMNVGSIYLSTNNYDMAIRFFTDAVNLKPDFPNAYFNLAVAYNQKGDTNNAMLIAEKTVSLLDPKSEDYKTASQFLSQLKDKSASEAAKLQVEQQAKGEKNGQNLQNANLPKVINLPKQENISTPAAIYQSPPPTETR